MPPAERVRLVPPSAPNASVPSQPKTLPVGAPRIQIHAVDDLSYPMAHCRIPVIDHITVDNTGADLRSALVEVDVVSAEGSHGGPQEIFPRPGSAQADDSARCRSEIGSRRDAAG